MKQIVQNLITKKAKKLIEQHKPIIITITGSVGKTSTRKTIAHVLSKKFNVGTTIENYNNEFGVPLSILGKKSPGKSVFGWLGILFSKQKKLPQVYVLELGIDHPGDMKHLCSIVNPDIAVFTAVSPVHLEFFPSIDALVEEKAYMLECVNEGGLAILNADDPRVMGAAKHAKVDHKTFGFSQTAQIRASEFKLETRDDFSFEPGEQFSEIHARIDTEENTGELILANALGRVSVLSALAAFAVGEHLGMSLPEMIDAVRDVKQEPGRMNPIPAIKGALILDSSYNAAPASMASSLEVLSSFGVKENTKRIAVLGHMAELGPQTEQEHRVLGMRVAEHGVDMLVAVGERSKDTIHGAVEAGMSESSTHFFETSEEAGRFLDREINKGDVILVKGSQSARMEKVVKDIMAEPQRAKELLVRQKGKWIKE